MKHQKIEDVSETFWNDEVNKETKELIEDFLSRRDLSKDTIKQYTSNMKIFARWVHETYSKDKLITDLRPRDARRYQDWLVDKGLSPSAIKAKRSAVSSFCNHIEGFYDGADEYPDFRNIFTKAVPNVKKSNVKEKLPLSSFEMNKLVAELTRREEWQKLAYLEYTFITGCRREESRQLLKEVVEYENLKNKDGSPLMENGKEKIIYETHLIRAKGEGIEGKVRRFKFNDETMTYLKKWIDYRKDLVDEDDCEYMFVSKRHGKFNQLSANTFNNWCKEFSEILGGRPVHPHLIRSSRATIAVVEEKIDIKKVQTMLGHESSETTEIYVVRDDDEDYEGLL